MQITIDIPEEAFSILRKGPEEFVREMRLAAVVKWYELEQLSQSKAAEIAGISRTEFLELLSRFQVSPFQETPDDLEREMRGD